MTESRHTHADSADGHGTVDCSQIVLRVFEFIDKETSPTDSRRIKAHLDGCAQCLDEYERDVLLKALVRRSCQGHAAPGELRNRIMSRLTSVTVQTSRDGSSETVQAVEVIEEAVERWDRPRS